MSNKENCGFRYVISSIEIVTPTKSEFFGDNKDDGVKLEIERIMEKHKSEETQQLLASTENPNNTEDEQFPNNSRIVDENERIVGAQLELCSTDVNDSESLTDFIDSCLLVPDKISDISYLVRKMCEIKGRLVSNEQ